MLREKPSQIVCRDDEARPGHKGLLERPSRVGKITMLFIRKPKHAQDRRATRIGGCGRLEHCD